MVALGSAGGVAVLLNDNRAFQEPYGRALREFVAFGSLSRAHRSSQNPQIGLLPGHVNELLAGGEFRDGSSAPRPRALLSRAPREEHERRQRNSNDFHLDVFHLQFSLERT